MVMLLLTLVLARRNGNAAAAGLGLLAGVGFGVTSLAVRVLDVDSVAAVFTDPAAYGLALGGLGGYLAYALALQRGTVTAATAAGTVAETFGPALVGLTALGDAARPGYAWCAVAGFAVAVGGTFVLSRFGEVEAEVGPTTPARPPPLLPPPPPPPLPPPRPRCRSARCASAPCATVPARGPDRCPPWHPAGPVARTASPCEGDLPDKSDGAARTERQEP
ncbi:hypothetical protein ACFQ0M_42630 [Kitasatospora aburaviensis]